MERRLLKSGVYKITCGVSGKVYVGSAKNLVVRIRDHKSWMIRGTHPNRKLQGSWNKYGPDSFSFEVIERCPISLLIETEQKWIDNFDCFKNGLNLRPVAKNNLDFKFTVESRQRMSKSHLGKPGFWTGKHRDQATKDKLSVSCSGPRNPWFGKKRKHSEITLARIRAGVGKGPDNVHYGKPSHLRGTKASARTRAKLRRGQRLRRAREKVLKMNSA